MVKVFFSPVVSRDISMKYIYQDQILISLPIDAPTKSRIAVAPVVGWPPIRSFRKNFGSRNFSKPAPKSPNETPKEGSDGEKLVNLEHHMFVKINMDGVPIGRKVDLKAYDSYEKLSFAIDELFGDLLAGNLQTHSTWKIILLFKFYGRLQKKNNNNFRNLYPFSD